MLWGIKHLDADDYQWEVSDPPYQRRTSETWRRESLASDLRQHESWVLSGSIHYWGDTIFPTLDFVILVVTPQIIRLSRLLSREQEKFARRIAKGGDMYRTHEEFMRKAASYEAGDESVRSLARDKKWLKSLRCPTLCINGALSIAEILESIHHVATDI